jgi:hypothetical protein
MYRKNIVAVSLLEEFIRRQISNICRFYVVLKFEHIMSVVVPSVNYLFSGVLF